MKCKKVKYRDKLSAMIALYSCRRSSRAGNSVRMERRVYYCAACRAWHLTSKEDRRELKPDADVGLQDQMLYRLSGSER